MRKLAELYREFQNHDFWETGKFENAKGYLFSKRYGKMVEERGKLFNSAKLHLAYSRLYFDGCEREARGLIVDFLEEKYDEKDELLSKNHPDPRAHLQTFTL